MIQVYDGNGVEPLRRIALGNRVGWARLRGGDAHCMGFVVAYACWRPHHDEGFGLTTTERFHCAEDESTLLVVDAPDKILLFTHTDAIDLGPSGLSQVELDRIRAKELERRGNKIPSGI